MLAFFLVILVAVGTVALLSERATEVEFRRYASLGGKWERLATDLATYYAEHNSWKGIQDALHSLQQQGAGQQGRGRGSGEGGTGLLSSDFQLADSEGYIVGDTTGPPSGTISQEELAVNIPIQVEDRVVGYLIPSHPSNAPLPTALDVEQTQFLERVRQALVIAALAATAAALVIGGLLFHSIVAPLHRLTIASQAIADGDLTVRAPVLGQDEVAQLANAFNQMAESLARAEEARRNQTADVAHELRTPLTVLQGAIEAMLDGVYPTDRENLLTALTQARTLTRLVEDLRLLALADAGQLQLYKAPLNLEAFLSETVKAYQLPAQEREASLTLETSSNLPLVEADRDRLAQVMGNLLNNALRYTPQGGQIRVRTTVREHEVIVSVTDSGPGISSEELPHLFERFWHSDQDRRQATSGSGLGLAIARSLIEAHGGRIWPESIEGEGSTFSFTLPTVHES
jgi:two-component system OmpR family sensor kinase/two-component system sensor histidine kinase BaeS